MTLPKLSSAAKLYAIFALMATASIALSVVAVHSARNHAALTGEFESANSGSWNVERANGLIYALIAEWQRSVRTSDSTAFSQFAVRISEFQAFVPELARIATESGPQAARIWSDKNHPAQARDALNKDLETLSQHYTDRAQRIYTVLDQGIDNTAIERARAPTSS